VYSTCSIEPEENANIVQWFLEKHPEFTLDNAESRLPADVCKDGMLQTLPHLHKSDGAFGARLVRAR
jgi:16S rRNA (cytosine967-C5)-methyltransferase